MLVASISFQLVFLTVITMVAFAGNSVFCRLALVDSNNDPVSFTLVRLAAGAIALLFLFIKYRKEEPITYNKNILLAPVMLFSYALFFSLSYVRMSAGTGALILFASVQLTMIITALVRGQKLNIYEWFGFSLAAGGLIYLLLPSLDMPPLTSMLSMTIAGVSWGIYSLLGQKSKNPFLSTSRNFLLILPAAVIYLAIYSINLTNQGLLWAVLSGAVTSGMGYVLWYVVLRKLATSTAAIVQLSVPAIAAFGGVLFLDEIIHLRLIIASLLIFSGITLKLLSK